MPKTKISEFSATAGNNTDIDGINIAEGCPPSGINDAIRELMAQLKDFQAGTAGDSFNGPIGTTTPAAGVFTNLSASGTFALTGDQVQISEGGTGQTTANAAFNALAPSQSTHAGKYLKTDGTNTSWDALDISTADITGTLPIANGGTGLTALGTGVQTALGQNVTGSGGIVLASSPSLTTPNLGTPSAVTLTNATGLPLSTGVTGTLATTNGGTGLTSFTANGVVYASSSSVLATGSVLTLNGTALGVNGTNANIAIDGGGVGGIGNVLGVVGTSYGYVGTTTNTPLVFLQNNAELMRLTSTGLGIGTSSPNSRIEAYSSTASSGTPIVVATLTSYSGVVNGNGAALLFRGQSNAGVYSAAQISSRLTDGTPSAEKASLTFSTVRSGTITEAMTLDSSGNLGLGVTPSAGKVGTYTKNFEIGAVGNTIRGDGSSTIIVAANAYYDATDSRWEYAWTNLATNYTQQDGIHKWFTAPSGTAGDPISFTQAMTLDASGNLSVGNTSGGSFFSENESKFSVGTGSANTGAITLYSASTGHGAINWADGTSGAATYAGILRYDHNLNAMQFYTNGLNERFRIGPAGQIGLSGANYGTSGQVLTSNGSGSAPTWQNASGSSQWTTSGSDIYYTTGNVAVGTTSTTFGGNTQRFSVSGAKTYSEGQPRSQLIVSDSTAQAAGVGGAVMLVGVYDGSGNTTGFASVEAAKENGTSGNYAGALVLKSRSNGGNLTERARFNSTGALVLAGGTATADGIGITFPATQSASSDANTLDDYEEGTWTPSLGGTATYNSRTGTYTKIGRMVTVFFAVDVATIGTGQQDIISGLPFSNFASNRGTGTVAFVSGLATTQVSLFPYVPVSDNLIKFVANSGSAWAQNINVFTSGTVVSGSVTYFV